MAKDKDKQLNPAAAALKKQKAAALKKGKAQVAAQRTERLANRNPARLQKQIDELKETEARDGALRPRDKQTLEGLERDLRMIKKARESLGDKAPGFGGGNGGRREDGHRRDGEPDGGGRGRGGGVLGKRRRDGQTGWTRHNDDEIRSESSETDEDARAIPMPTDVENEPPIPRRNRHRPPQPRSTNPNETPLGEPRMPHALPEKPVVKAQTVYEAAPQIRNLQKEAVARFVPTAVAAKRKLAQGKGRLLEPEEADRLERQGYMGGNEDKVVAQKDVDALRREEERFAREMEGLATADNVNNASLAYTPSAATTQNGAGGGRKTRQVEIEDVVDEG